MNGVVSGVGVRPLRTRSRQWCWSGTAQHHQRIFQARSPRSAARKEWVMSTEKPHPSPQKCIRPGAGARWWSWPWPCLPSRRAPEAAVAPATARVEFPHRRRSLLPSRPRAINPVPAAMPRPCHAPVVPRPARPAFSPAPSLDDSIAKSISGKAIVSSCPQRPPFRGKGHPVFAKRLDVTSFPCPSRSARRFTMGQAPPDHVTPEARIDRRRRHDARARRAVGEERVRHHPQPRCEARPGTA